MFKTTQAKLMLITEACVSRGQEYEEWHLGAKIFLTTTMRVQNGSCLPLRASGPPAVKEPARAACSRFAL